MNTGFLDSRTVTLGTGTPTINVATGQTATLSTPLAGAGTLTKAGLGTLITQNLPTAGATINGGTLRLAATTPNQASRVSNNLTVLAGQLDLTNNDLMVTNGSVSTLTALLTSAYANGAWTGNGIFSSTAASATDEALGILSGANFLTLHPGSLFDGQSVNSTDALLKYTFQGDADLDGKVTLADYAQIDAGFYFHPTAATWAGGDFDYNGVVDYHDYALIDYTFQNYPGQVLANDMIALHTVEFGQPYVDALESLNQPVPEPASLAVLLLGTVTLLRRRPRR